MSYMESVSRSGYLLKREDGSVVAVHRVTSNYALPMVLSGAMSGVPSDLADGLYRAKVVHHGADKYEVVVGKPVKMAAELARLDGLVAGKPSYHATKKPGVAGYLKKEALVNAAADEAKRVTRRVAASLRSL